MTTTNVAELSLYHYEGCPFCHRVWHAAQQLGVQIESRDIMREPAHRRALLAARGRATVPVLRIETGDGEEVWMPESSDIIRYLNGRFGE